MQTFHFWCQKVLPLVYEDSLSYLEVLCKVVDKLNEVIETTNLTNDDVKEIQTEIAEIQNWIKNFNTSYIQGLIEKYITTAIFVGITDSGYIFYTRPESWRDIQFNTTGLDIAVESQPEYGHLVLSY